MSDRTDFIGELASRYITKRDNFRTRYMHRNTGLFTGSGGGSLAFSELITEHAIELAALLPPMTLTQWEAVSELSSSYLAHLRMIEAGRKNDNG